VRPGTNSKMSETDCAQMMVKLKYFDKWQKRRTEIANYYIDQIQDCVQVLTANEGVQHAWSKFVIRLDNRHALRSVLNHAGIETKIHYETTLSELDVSFQFNDGQQLRESVAFTHESLSLPIYPELSDSEVEHIASSVKKYLS
jgi:dTDP-4-amino-4,6-dideoxygalactose transaminase